VSVNLYSWLIDLLRSRGRMCGKAMCHVSLAGQLPSGGLGLRPSASRGNSVGLSSGMTHNVCVCAVVGFRSRHCPRGQTLNEDNTYSLHVTPPLRKHFVMHMCRMHCTKTTRMPVLWFACRQARHWHWCGYSKLEICTFLMIYYDLLLRYVLTDSDGEIIKAR
jgi:hypothetical protein